MRKEVLAGKVMHLKFLNIYISMLEEQGKRGKTKKIKIKNGLKLFAIYASSSAISLNALCLGYGVFR